MDVEEHALHSGVQLNTLADVLDEANEDGTVLFVRYLFITRDDAFQQKIVQIHTDVHEKPYDINLYDWICAEYNLEYRLPTDVSHQEKQTFWCSALVAYVYCQLGVLSTSVNWSIIAPKAFSSTESMLEFLKPMSVDIKLSDLS